ncbi:hypothetical protein [Candidatus Neptunochlamydia vexilliferae]|nr:hypothetical protein [Candidatus Neptunochlamydia vexilliferae]
MYTTGANPYIESKIKWNKLWIEVMKEEDPKLAAEADKCFQQEAKEMYKALEKQKIFEQIAGNILKKHGY